MSYFLAFQYRGILNLYRVLFHAVVIFGPGHDILFKSASTYCVVHKAKLTSRKLAISFLVTECVVLHMSVYGKKEWKKKETE